MTTGGIILAAVGVLIGAVVGFIVGERRGFVHGEASGWVESYFAGVRKDRARRERNGQFAMTKGRVKA